MSVNVNILLKGETHFMVHNSVKYIILSTFLTDLWDFVKFVRRSGNEMYGENCPLIFFWAATTREKGIWSRGFVLSFSFGTGEETLFCESSESDLIGFCVAGSAINLVVSFTTVGITNPLARLSFFSESLYCTLVDSDKKKKFHNFLTKISEL